MEREASGGANRRPDSRKQRQEGNFATRLYGRWKKVKPKRRRFVGRLLLFLLIAGLLYGGARLVAEWTWKGDVSRQAIMAVAILLWAISALLLFGTGGWKAFAAFATTLAGLVAFAGATIHASAILPEGSPPHGALVDCPDLAEAPAGTEYVEGEVGDTQFGYAHLREEPRLQSSPIDLRYPAGCRLAFSGWCVGEPKSDWRFHVPDPVWFKNVDTPGYVASADLNIDPPPRDLD